MFAEPRTFTLSKYRLLYSIALMVVIVGTTLLEGGRIPVACTALLILFGVYLFIPFAYRLVVSNEAISSINLLASSTLEWNEIVEVRFRRGNLHLSNRDGSVSVQINQQIDHFPDVIEFVKERRPDLWKLEEIQSFHQDHAESMVSIFLGVMILGLGVWKMLDPGLSGSAGLVVLGLFLVAGYLVFSGSSKIRNLSLDGDHLVVKTLIRERRIHVSEVRSVTLEQQFGRNEIHYPVHIRLGNGRDLIIDRVREGNPLLVNTIERWMVKHGQSQPGEKDDE